MAKKIGSDDCPILSLCNTLRHTSAFRLSAGQWFHVAQDLLGDEAENIPDDIEYEGYSLYQAYNVLLNMWMDKDGNGATLDRLMEILDGHKLFDATDKIRKRFGCRPKPINDLAKKIQDLDVKKEEKSYLFDNISGLADGTNVTEKLLERLKEKDIISQDEIWKLNTEDDDSKSLTLYSILSDGKFALSDLIQVLDDEGLYGPSWILRDFYHWVIKNRDSLKTKSIPSSENAYSSSRALIPIHSAYLFFPVDLKMLRILDSESGCTDQHQPFHLSPKTLQTC